MRILGSSPWRYKSRLRDDGGAATVEFVFLGILLIVPMLYVTIAVFDAQRNAFAVTQAAREAGRAFATAPDVATGVTSARYAVRLAFRDQGIDGSAALRFISVDEKCGNQALAGPGDPGAASLEPGSQFTVCVTRDFNIPGVPTWFGHKPSTLTGRYVVRVDEFRTEDSQNKDQEKEPAR